MPSQTTIDKATELLLNYDSQSKFSVTYKNGVYNMYSNYERAMVTARARFISDDMYLPYVKEPLGEGRQLISHFLTCPYLPKYNLHLRKMIATLTKFENQPLDSTNQHAAIIHDVYDYQYSLKEEVPLDISAQQWFINAREHLMQQHFLTTNARAPTAEDDECIKLTSSLIDTLARPFVLPETINFILSQSIDDLIIQRMPQRGAPILLTALAWPHSEYIRCMLTQRRQDFETEVFVDTEQEMKRILRDFVSRLQQNEKNDQVPPHPKPKAHPKRTNQDETGAEESEHNEPPTKPTRQNVFEPGGTDGESTDTDNQNDKPPVIPPRKKGESKPDYIKRTKKEHKAYKDWLESNDIYDDDDDDETESGKGKGKENDDKKKKTKKEKTSDDEDSDDEMETNPTQQDDLEDYILTELLERAKDTIADRRKHPSKYKAQSHLKRFTDAKGISAHIIRDQISDTDIIISLLDDEHSARYVLTFGGEDRHPIFNRIESDEWNQMS